MKKNKDCSVKQPSFEPRQSTRISTRVEADNDQWTEFLTIIDLLNPRTNSYELQIRSFFESKATEKKVWDEPPSGAKNVVWASEEAKKMAQEQMKDLKAVGTLPRNGQKEDRGTIKVPVRYPYSGSLSEIIAEHLQPEP